MELPIAEAMTAYDKILAEPFAGLQPDVTEENIQSRIRGALMMALSTSSARCCSPPEIRAS